jgi:hypothetical protein
MSGISDDTVNDGRELLQHNLVDVNVKENHGDTALIVAYFNDNLFKNDNLDINAIYMPKMANPAQAIST